MANPDPSARPTFGTFADIGLLFKTHFGHDALVQPCLVRAPDGKMWYEGHDTQPRLRAEARTQLDQVGCAIIFESIWIDVDHVPHAASPSDEWYNKIIQAVQTKLPNGCAYYDTPHGMRLLWQLVPALDLMAYQAYATSFGEYLAGMLNDGNTKVDTCYADAVHGYYPPHCIRLDETEPYVPRHLSWEDLGPLNWAPPDDGFERDEMSLLSDAVRVIRKQGRKRFTLPDRIPEGRRNRTLFEYASALVARGFQEEYIANEIRKVYRERCDHDPPMYDSELERMVYTTYRKYATTDVTPATATQVPGRLTVVDRTVTANDPTPSAAAVELAQVGAGDLFSVYDAATQGRVVGEPTQTGTAPAQPDLPQPVNAMNAQYASAPLLSSSGVYLASYVLTRMEGGTYDEFGKEVPGPPDARLVFDRGNFYKYHPPAGCWVLIPEHKMIEYIGTLDQLPVVTGLRDGSPVLKPLQLGARVIKGDILPMAQYKRTEAGYFNGARPGAVFADCFVTLQDGELVLEPNSRDHRALYAFPHKYDDTRVPEQFIAFFNDLFRDDSDIERTQKVQLIREFLGAAILGIATRFESALFLIGNGRNGKSTLLSILKRVFLSTGMDSGFVASLSPQAMTEATEVSMLTRAAINLVDDMPRDAMMDTSNLKSIVSGKDIRGRERHHQAYTFVPRCAHIFNMNFPPVVRDTSDGFWRRAIVIEFRRQIEKSEVRHDIVDRICANELEAIACWLVAAVPTLLARGDYSMPDSSRRILSSWRTSSDSALEFLASLAEGDFAKDTAQFVGRHDLYNKYSAWCAQSNKKPYGPGAALRHIAESLKVQIHNDRGVKGIMLPSRTDLALLTGVDLE